MKTALSDYLKSLPFYVLPHHMLSRLAYYLARISWPPLKNLFIRLYLRLHRLNMNEAVISDPFAYPSLNALFTRALKAEARPKAEGEHVMLCPVDGRVSQAGRIEQGQLFQAKGHNYSLETLLGGISSLAQQFAGGNFATLYLSPIDYHRVHMPVDGRLTDTVYVAGRLFSVAPHTVRAIPGLFARNERLACVFDTAAGPLALILVGAINVSAIETVWDGEAGHRWHGIRHSSYSETDTISLSKGAEMGRFNLGSTVIVLTGANTQWDQAITAASAVRLGQALAEFRS